MQTVIMTCFWIALWSFTVGCDSDLTIDTQGTAAPEEAKTRSTAKLSNHGECIDPDLSGVSSDISLTLCNGELAQGQLPVCSEDGGSHCVTGETFVAMNKTKVDPAKILSGMNVAGIMGTMPPPPTDCAADGTVGCVTTNAFKAAAMENVLAGNITSGVTIAGVTGSANLELHTNCSSDGETGCVATASYAAADMSRVTAANIRNGITIAGQMGAYPSVSAPLVGATATTDLQSLAATTAAGSYEFFDSTGTRYIGSISDAGTITAGTSAIVYNASLYRQFTVAGDADLVASNIKDAVSLFGVTGNLSGAPANCSSNGEMGCVTTSAYQAADLTNLISGNIKNGITVAGTAGTYPSLASPLEGASGTSDLTSMAANTPAGNYEFFDSVGTRYTGSISDAETVTAGTADQSFSTSLYRQFTVAGDADLVAANIIAGINIFGIAGAVTPSPATCNANNIEGCVTTATYKSADLTNLTAANVKSGVVLAGVTGDYPSATNRLAGADDTTDLPAFASTTGGSTYEWFTSDGSRLTGSIQANQTLTPSASNQTVNSGLYRSVTVNGDADLDAANIKSGANIFGVAGSVTPSPATCNANGTVGCVTTATYKSADLTNLSAGNIKKSVAIAGVTGDFPSATYKLPGADTTADLDSATFNAKVKSSADFEFWNAEGVRQVQSGDADIVASSIKTGISIFGTTGSLVAINSDNGATNATPGADCKTIKYFYPGATDGLYWIVPYGGGAAFQAYCDMSTDGGGWTLVMRMKADSNVLNYSSAYWTNTALFNESGLTSPTDDSNAKFQAFNDVRGTTIRGCMGTPSTSNCITSLTSLGNASPYQMFTGSGYGASDMTRLQFTTLFGDVVGEENCNANGINRYGSPSSYVRFGWIGNNENNCGSTDVTWGWGLSQGNNTIACGVGRSAHSAISTSLCVQGSLWVR